jgi:hypothetical protein
MSSRAKRVLAASAVLGVAGAGAATVPAAAAPDPVIIGECGAHVSAQKGQPMELSLSNALGVDGLPNIPLGTAEPGTHHYNPKGAIQNALSGSGLLGGLLGGATGLVGDVLDAGCPMVVTVKDVVNHAAAPVQQETQQLDSVVPDPVKNTVRKVLPQHSGHEPSHQSGSGSEKPEHQQKPDSRRAAPQVSTQDTQTRESRIPPALAKQLSLPASAFSVPAEPYRGAVSPAALYTGVPFSSFGLFTPPNFDLSSGVPGFAPEFGLLGKNNSANSARAGADAVRTAGNAQALGAQTPTHKDTVSLPLLVAALALAGAVAGLVRTWVLRRPS